MKLLVAFLLFITLPYMIHCAHPNKFLAEVKRLDALAKSKSSINGAIMLKKKGFLGYGTFGFVYEGKTLANKNSVAVKFATEANENHIEREFQIYQYLDAYQNPQVERFGIPMVHHYGKWEGFTFIAISKFFGNLNNIKRNERRKTPVNVLIFFRNFVIQSKYMHSKGVRHDDIKLGNVMIRGHQTFLIDFNMSAKMANYRNSCSLSFASRRYHRNVLRHAVDDWESFLYSMCHMLGVPLKWFKAGYKAKIFEERRRLLGELKHQTQNVQNLINRHIVDDDLNEIFNHFAAEVYDESKFVPNYDVLENLISEKIMKYHDEKSPFPPTFTWLTDAEKEWAMKNPLPDIKKDIREPADIDFKSFDYSNAFQSEGQSSGTAHDDGDHRHHTSLEENVERSPEISATKCCLLQ